MKIAIMAKKDSPNFGKIVLIDRAFGSTYVRGFFGKLYDQGLRLETQPLVIEDSYPVENVIELSEHELMALEKDQEFFEVVYRMCLDVKIAIALENKGYIPARFWE